MTRPCPRKFVLATRLPRRVRYPRRTMPAFGYTLWLSSNSGLSQEWEDIQGLCADVLDLVAQAEYADDPGSLDVTSIPEDVVELLKTATEK